MSAYKTQITKGHAGVMCLKTDTFDEKLAVFKSSATLNYLILIIMLKGRFSDFCRFTSWKVLY